MKHPRRLQHLPKLPVRSSSGHKGMFGRVLIIGGSDGMIGAPAFAGLAALRMGCGLAYVATQREMLPYILITAPELVGVPVTRSSDLNMAIESCTSIVVGPGMGTTSFAITMLQAAIASSLPLLIDADGLNLLASGHVELDRPAMTTVLTPHPGEMIRLGKLIGFDRVPDDDDGRLEVAVAVAKYFSQVILLKGEKKVITDGNSYAVNTTGDSTLAKAGSGDILSGMIGTLLGQNVLPMDAARLGAYYHGKAGEQAGKILGRRSALARDITDAIPNVLPR